MTSIVSILVAILLAFSPKVGAVIFAMPLGVLGGVTTALYGLIGVIGILVVADVNPFKRLQVGISAERRKGLWSGAVLGASLGLVWIPCVGPFLSAVLGMVAAKASDIAKGSFIGVGARPQA